MLELIQTADQSYTLYNKSYKESYHSQKGALTEAKHVFLKGAGVYEYIEQKKDICVLEVGFGTGLNFFLTADTCFDAGIKLSYTALEKDLLDFKIIKKLGYDQFLSQSKTLESFLKWRETLPDKPNTGKYVLSLGNSQLNIYVGEATRHKMARATYDAIYLDAFSPSANPELWSVDFLQNLYQALAPTGKLSSYCVKGEIRRRMQSVGFKVEKWPGPPNGKREMLVASYNNS